MSAFFFSLSDEPYLQILQRASRCGPKDRKPALIEVLGKVLGPEGSRLCQEFVAFYVLRLRDPRELLAEGIQAGRSCIEAAFSLQWEAPAFRAARERQASRILKVRACPPAERILRLHIVAALCDSMAPLLEALETSSRPEPYLNEEIADRRISGIVDRTFAHWWRGILDFASVRRIALPQLRLGLGDLEESRRYAPHEAEQLQEEIRRARLRMKALQDEDSLAALMVHGMGP